MRAKNFAHPRIFLVATLAVTGTLVANDVSTKQQARVDYTRSLSFEPNRGQTDRQVDFLAHSTGYILFLSHSEAVIALHRRKSNYFTGSAPERWHTGIPNYAKVRYAGVYPGIDMIYYENQGSSSTTSLSSPALILATSRSIFKAKAKARPS